MEQMAGLPSRERKTNVFTCRWVRELVLNARYFAALAVEDWRQAIELSAVSLWGARSLHAV